MAEEVLNPIIQVTQMQTLMEGENGRFTLQLLIRQLLFSLDKPSKKSLAANTNQHQWETDRVAWDWWSPAVLYSHQKSKTLVWGLLEPQPQRRAPSPGTYPSRVRGAGGVAGAPWAGGGLVACAARWHSLDGHSAAGGFGKWAGWAELLFYTTCSWRWQLGCPEFASPGLRALTLSQGVCFTQLLDLWQVECVLHCVLNAPWVWS